MVYILKTDDTVIKGRLRRYLHKRFGRKVRVSGDKAGGMPCCTVTAETDGGISWDEVESAVIGENEIVMPTKLKLPTNTRLKRVSGERLRRRVLINGALYAIEKSADGGALVQSVALLDKTGAYSPLLPRLLKSVKTVTVVTAEENEYNALAESLFESIGVAPVVTSSASATSGCDALLAPDGIAGFGALEMASVMFTPDRRDGFTVDDSCISAPFSPDLLTEYGAFDLLQAFSGHKRLADVSQTVPHSFISSSRRITVDEVSGMFTPVKDCY